MTAPQYITPDPATADAGYVVVSTWSDAGDRSGYKTTTDYQRFDDLRDALDAYAEYDRGEFARARATGIFAVNAEGMPLRHLSPLWLIKALREIERDRRAA